MKQIKKPAVKRKYSKTSNIITIPKMSIARQNYIKRFRKKIITLANERFQVEVKHYDSVRLQIRKESATPVREDRLDETNSLQEPRRVKFDEESNQTYEYQKWIEDFELDEVESQESESNKSNDSDEDYVIKKR